LNGIKTYLDRRGKKKVRRKSLEIANNTMVPELNYPQR